VGTRESWDIRSSDDADILSFIVASFELWKKERLRWILLWRTISKRIVRAGCHVTG
jgi:hypothetical protein